MSPRVPHGRQRSQETSGHWGLMSGASERAGNLSWFIWMLEGESQTHRQRRGCRSKHLSHVYAWAKTSIFTCPQTLAFLILGLSDSDRDCIYPPICRSSDSEWIIPQLLRDKRQGEQEMGQKRSVWVHLGVWGFLNDPSQGSNSPNLLMKPSWLA